MRRGMRWLGVLALAGLIGCGGESRHNSDPQSSSQPSGPRATQAPSPPEPAAPEPPALPEPPASRRVQAGPYTADAGRDCDGYPRLPLRTPPGLCVGIVAHAEDPVIAASQLRFRPRTLIEDPARAERFWLVDAGPQRARAGRLWKLEIVDRQARFTRVLERLDRPHGSRLGPDGWIYLGEVERIARFDPSAPDPGATLETVIGGLPAQQTRADRIRFHPMKSFVFAPDWDLIVNMGSSTDHCAESLGAESLAAGETRCHDEEEHNASIWRFDYLGERRWSPDPEHLAHGLRNSVALVAHPSGTILQGENGTDFPEVDRPHEELNVIERGRHYGWPYCYDRDRADDRWAHADFACDPARNPVYAPPLILLPPHGAPLDMLYYRAERLSVLQGHLLISLHGYREPGHRILSFEVGARGLPARDAPWQELIGDWSPSEERPRGAPVGMTVARDGSLWLVEDTNGTVLRLSTDRYRSTGPIAGPDARPLPPAGAAFTALHHDVLSPRCSRCHDHLRGGADHALAGVRREGWLRIEDGEPVMWQRTRPGATKRMPLDGTLSDRETRTIRAWLDTERPAAPRP